MSWNDFIDTRMLVLDVDMLEQDKVQNFPMVPGRTMWVPRLPQKQYVNRGSSALATQSATVSIRVFGDGRREQTSDDLFACRRLGCMDDKPALPLKAYLN
jgi:hypothetical protein